ncbi:MAG TPA: CBS domain-containing protein [Kofleriaceae bacterium]
MSQLTSASCRIYRRGGGIEQIVASIPEAAAPSSPTVAGSVPVTAIMSRDVICVHRNLEIEHVIDLLVRKYVGCVPVVDRANFPVGMITTRDLVAQLGGLFGQSSDSDETPHASELSPRTAEEIMLPLAITLDQTATVSQAAALMAHEGFHHLPVVASGRVIGIVSSFDIVAWLARNDAA